MYATDNGQSNETHLIIIGIGLVEKTQANRVKYHKWPNDGSQSQRIDFVKRDIMN